VNGGEEMKSRTLQWLGSGLLILIAVVHLYMAPAEYEESALLGYLFIANFLAALVAIVGIRRRASWGWVVGFWVAGGAIASYVVTRTVGMPGMEAEEWLYPVGVLSIALETAFLVLFVLARPWAGHPEAGRRGTLVAPAAAVAFVAAFGLAGFLWGALSQDQGMPNLAHAEQVSDSAFAEQFGVQVLQITPSMMDSIVDFRLRIVDRTKAEKLLADHTKMPMLLVNDGRVVLTAPNQHMHQRSLKDGGMYFAFYPNPNRVVRPGTAVSVQFGNLRLPATVAQ
jgi:hypothetical protein